MTSSVTSDRDYLEIVYDGEVTISTGDTDSDATQPSTVYEGANYGVYTVTHNLGNFPMVRAFYDPNKNGQWHNTFKYLGTGYQTRDNPWLMHVSTTTTTKLIIASNVVETDIPVRYRIYRFLENRSISSDERVDKIFEKNTASATLSAASNSITPQTTTQTILHGKSVPVLNTLQFSTDQVTWYNAGCFLFNGFDTSSGPPGGPYARYYYSTVYGYSDDTNFYVYYEHNNSTSQTIYVRYELDYWE